MQYLSEITTQASGSAGGVTASHNQHARYLRARSYPTDPKTFRQRVMRNAFRSTSTLWSDILTPAQRQAWDNYAANVPLPNALGDRVLLTGRHHFMAVNLYIIALPGTQTAKLNAPTIFDRSAHTNPTYTGEATDNFIRVYYDNTEQWAIETGGWICWRISLPQSSTINFYKGPYRLIAAAQGRDGGGLPVPGTIYTPTFLVEGQRFFFQARTLTKDGRLASSTAGLCVVGPPPT